jgi:hypothetical protein
VSTRFIFHVGPERTGSTYLQHRLAASRTHLLAGGIYYAEEWIAPPGGVEHAELCRMLEQEGSETELAQGFAAIAALGHPVVVLSCTGLAQLDEAALARLKTALDGRPAEFFFHIRRWSKRLASCWNQEIQEGSFRTLPEFYMDFFSEPVESRQIDYARMWEPVVAVFGREALRLVCYSNLTDRGIDIYRHFCERCLGFKGPAGPPSPGRREISRSPEATELRRVLNEIGARSALPGAPAMTQSAHNLDGPMFESLRSAIHRNLETIEFNDMSDRFDVAYRRIAEYADRVVDGMPPWGMFKRIITVHTYARPDYLAEPGVLPALLALHEREAGRSSG